MSRHGPRSKCPQYGWMSKERVDTLCEWQNLPSSGWAYSNSELSMILERQPDDTSTVQVGHRGTLSVPGWKNGVEDWSKLSYAWWVKSRRYSNHVWWVYKVLPFGLVVRTTEHRYFLASLNWWCRC